MHTQGIYDTVKVDNGRMAKGPRLRRRRTGDRRRPCACLRGGEEPACGSVEEMRSVVVMATGRYNEIVRAIDAVPEEFDTAHLG